MQSKGNAPTAAQKRWREAVRELGSVISGGPAVIHHAVGHTGRHNKELIGPYWLVPLTDEEHKALHRGEKPWQASSKFKGIETRKEFEKAAYVEVGSIACGSWKSVDGITPDDFPPLTVHAAIMDYHK